VASVAAAEIQTRPQRLSTANCSPMAFQLIDFILPNLQIFSEVYTRPGDGHEPFEPRERRGSVVQLKRSKNRFFPGANQVFRVF
jgi:hypothetical protein